MKQVVTSIAISLLMFIPKTYGSEPTLIGVWRLTSMTAYEKGKITHSGKPKMFGKEMKISLTVKRTSKGYEVVLIRVDGKQAPVFSFNIKKHGGDYRGNFSDGTKTLSALLRVKPAEIHAAIYPETLDQIPATFGAPKNSRQAKIEFTFKRPNAEAVIWVKAPQGATVSIGERSQVIKTSPLGIKTKPLSTDSETPFDVSLSAQIEGRLIKDRIRVWVTGGTDVNADFSDVGKPDVASRTFRYWECCIKHLHSGMILALNDKQDENRFRALSTMTKRIRSVPVRGVDGTAVKKWHAMADAFDRTVKYRRDAFGVDYLFESFARGAQGDPFGAALDRVKGLKQKTNEALDALLELKKLTPSLTLKYDTEFSNP